MIFWPFLFVFMLVSSYARVIKWQDCVELTYQRNETIHSTRQEWLAQKEIESIHRARYYPSLSASTSITRIGSSAANGGVVFTNGVLIGSAGSQINTNYLAQLTFNQNIFNGFEDESKIRQAEMQTQISHLKYLQALSQVSYQLRESYSNLLFSQELVSLSQKNKERRKSNYEIVKLRFENGRENKGSVLLAEAYLEQAQLDLFKARQNLDVAQNALKTILNVEDQETLFLNEDIPLIIQKKADNFEQLAISTPAYRQADLNEKISSETIRIAKASFLPDLNLSSILSRQGDSYFPQSERWQIGLTLTIPLFDGLKDLGNYRAALENNRAQKSKRNLAMLELLPKLKDALNQLEQSELTFKTSQKFQLAAQTRAEIARAKYNTGLLTFEDWEIIENELMVRELNFLTSKKDRAIKYGAWENIQGKGALH